MTTDRLRRAFSLGCVAGLVWVTTVFGGCSIRTVDVNTLPEELREPYALFQVRCSKCHTVARPLNAPVRDATHWELYITRMRRVPGSGINHEDARQILRFLTYYTEVIRGDTRRGGTSGGETSSGHEDASEGGAPANAADEGVIFEDDEEEHDATGE